MTERNRMPEVHHSTFDAASLRAQITMTDIRGGPIGETVDCWEAVLPPTSTPTAPCACASCAASKAGTAPAASLTARTARPRAMP